VKPDGPNEDARSAVKSADRLLDLFELLARFNGGLSHSAITEALGIPKSSLTQLLRTATGRGYVAYSAAGKGYRLGERFTSMARLTSRRQDLVGLVQPVLERITAQTGESSALNMLKGNEAEVVATISSSQRLVSHMRLGDMAPLYATSGGKVILAHMPESRRNEYLDGISFQPITANTLSSAAELRRQLDKIRREGIAYSFEEFTPGIIGLARAVLDEDGEALGAINVALPAVRYNPRAEALIADALDEAVTELQRQLASAGS
jgi:DNA-binding IclR family transcriptional regulator